MNQVGDELKFWHDVAAAKKQSDPDTKSANAKLNGIRTQNTKDGDYPHDLLNETTNTNGSAIDEAGENMPDG